MPQQEVKAGRAQSREAADRAAGLGQKFDPTAYVDEVKGRIEAAIQKKVEGQEISVAEAPPESGGKVIDLMEALRASLEKTEKAKAHRLAARTAQGAEARRAAGEGGPQVEPAVMRNEAVGGWRLADSRKGGQASNREHQPLTANR